MQLAEIVGDLMALRRDAGTNATEPYDVAAALAPTRIRGPLRCGCDVADGGVPAQAVSVDQVRGLIRDGPRDAR